MSVSYNNSIGVIERKIVLGIYEPRTEDERRMFAKEAFIMKFFAIKFFFVYF